MQMGPSLGRAGVPDLCLHQSEPKEKQLEFMQLKSCGVAELWYYCCQMVTKGGDGSKVLNYH